VDVGFVKETDIAVVVVADDEDEGGGGGGEEEEEEEEGEGEDLGREAASSAISLVAWVASAINIAGSFVSNRFIHFQYFCITSEFTIITRNLEPSGYDDDDDEAQAVGESVDSDSLDATAGGTGSPEGLGSLQTTGESVTERVPDPATGTA